MFPFRVRQKPPGAAASVASALLELGKRNLELRTAGKNDRALDEVFQLTYVAGQWYSVKAVIALVGIV